MALYTPSQRFAIAFLVLLIVVLTLVRNMWQEQSKEEQAAVVEQKMEERKPFSPHKFDPNTISLRQMLNMGLSKYEAVNIIRYREAVRNFRLREDLLLCYGISDSLYFALEPYIEIAPKYHYKAKGDSTTKFTPKATKREIKLRPFAIDTAGVNFFVSTGLLSPRQSEVLVKWRNRSGIHTFEELQACYTVSDSVANMLKPYVIFSPRPEKRVEIEAKIKPKDEKINLNKADAAELIAIYGIGEKTAAAIIDYRAKLRGFHSVEQLAEIKIITESNYEKIFSKFFVKNSDYSKIDINFAPAKQMKEHPYINDKSLRRLFHKRELKGGWSNVEELIEDKIFTLEEAEKLRPYLEFNLPQ